MYTTNSRQFMTFVKKKVKHLLSFQSASICCQKPLKVDKLRCLAWNIKSCDHLSEWQAGQPITTQPPCGYEISMEGHQICKETDHNIPTHKIGLLKGLLNSV